MSGKDPEKLSFEQAVEQLEAIIDRIESGEVGLEDSLKEYEAGAQLVKRCRAILDKAEKRIAELTADDEGKLAIEGEIDEQPDSDAPDDEQV